MPSDLRAPAVHRCLEVITACATEFVDLTDRLETFISLTGTRDGLLHVQTLHTTTGLLINEAEPLLLLDLMVRFERWAPADRAYAHDDLARRTVNVGPLERPNGYAHCRAALLRTSETVLVRGGRLCLGRWQRVLFAEFDGPQRRQVAATIVPVR